MRRLVIGDIHGCFVEFQELLQAAGLTSDDQVIALGDIVDRGPDPQRVLDWFATSPQATSLLGNHERKHVRSHRGEIRPALSQLITRRQLGESAYRSACATMDRFPRYLELPEAILTHGFYEPGIPISAQRENVLVGTLSGEGYLQQTYGQPWYTLYDGGRPLIVGHHDYLRTGQPLIHGNVYAIDTGCCHGGRLTGLLLPEFRIVSVPSHRDYWTELRQRFRHLGLTRVDARRLTWSQAQVIVEYHDGGDDDGVPESGLVAGVQELLQHGESAATLLYEEITRQHAEALRRLRQDDDQYDHMPPKQQASRYAAHIGKTALAKFMHLARKGVLDREAVRGSFRGPHDVLEFTQKLGIVDGEQSPSAPA